MPPPSLPQIGAATAPVMLELFGDLLCPDCMAAWPTVRSVISHYGPSKLLFILHVFPLPYHHQAYLSAWGAQIIKQLNGSDAAVFAWADALYGGAQTGFSTAATAGLTYTQVQGRCVGVAGEALARPAATLPRIHRRHLLSPPLPPPPPPPPPLPPLPPLSRRSFATLAAQTVPSITAAAFQAGYGDSNLDEAARVAWKYACSRSVTGTPSFFVNGLPVAADATWTLAQWQELLDPLFTEAPASPAEVGRRARAARVGRS